MREIRATDDYIEMTAMDYDMTVDEVLRVKSGLGPNDDFYEALERFMLERSLHDSK